MTILGIIGSQELIVILIIILVLFGAKKIPELMRGLGKGVKEYKDAMNGNSDDDNNKSISDKNPTDDSTK